MAFATLHCVDELQQAIDNEQTDALIVIGHFAHIENTQLSETIRAAQGTDQRVGKEALLISANDVPGNRMVVAPTGPLNRDYDDVRQVFDAAHKAAKIAQDAGARHPVILLNG